MAEFAEHMDRLGGQIRSVYSVPAANVVTYGGNGFSGAASFGGGGGGGYGSCNVAVGGGGGGVNWSAHERMLAAGMLTAAEARAMILGDGIEVTAIDSPRREFLPSGIPCSYCRTLGTGQQCWWCGAPRRDR